MCARAVVQACHLALPLPDFDYLCSSISLALKQLQ